MAAPLSNDDTRRWPPGKGREFDKLVVFSAWLLLASYDEDDDLLAEAAVEAFEAGDDDIWDDAQERMRTATWRRWRHLEHLNDEQFHAAMAVELVPQLERAFPALDHPLRLLRFVFDDKPLGVVRREWARAFGFWMESGALDRDAARTEWQVQSMECGLSQHPAALSYQLEDFLAAAVVPQYGERFLDLSARDGGTADRAAAMGARRFALYERDPDLALLAATRVRLHRACEVSVFLDDPLAAHEPEAVYDCVVALPPWGVKVLAPTLSRPAIPTSRIELLHLQRAIAGLKPGGRAAVVMPHRFLFGEGDDRRVREWLLREHRVEAVVELPARTFASELKSAVLLIRRQSPRDEVWSISADQFQEAGERPIKGDEPGALDYEILHAAIAARWNLGKPEKLRAEIARLETAAANAKYEMVEPNGIAWLTQNNRQLIALARHFLGEPMPGVSFPELVPMATLARRNWELLWKDGETESFDEWLKPVEEIAGARIATLGELAEEIFLGIPYTSAKTTVNIGGILSVPEDGDTSVGLVRVSDLPKPKSDSRALIHAHKALTAEAVAEVSPRQFLQDGDLLVSRSGTVGKTGVFVRREDNPQKSVAANGIIVVRVGDKRLGNFLAGLLQSAPYQAALQAETTGSVIRHLRIETIRSLRVPVLPTAEMLRLMEVLQPGVSAETMLAALQSRGSYTVALRYLADRPVVSEFGSRPLDEPWPQTHEALREVVSELRSAEDEASRGEHDVFLNWTAAFARAAESLEEILGFPPGADKLAALQSWRPRLRTSAFRKAYEELRRTVDSGDQRDPHSIPRQMLRRCEQLHDRLVALSRSVADALLADVRVNATITPAVVTVGKETELTIAVRNEGPLPLKRVTLDLPPTTVGAPRPWPLLPGKGAHQWPIPWLPEQAGKKTFRIGWRALRLDDEPVRGTFELSVEVQSLRAAALSDTLGESPYVFARVIDEASERVFFGRDEALNRLKKALMKSGACTILLVEGNRRIGKTSLLKFFARHHLPDGWVPVMINFQDFEGDTGPQAKKGIPTRKVFEGLAREVVAAVATALPGEELPGLGTPPPKTDLMFGRFLRRAAEAIDAESPFTSFRELFARLRERVRPKRLVLLLDEFDRLQEGIESGITSDQVPENLRHLFQSYNDVAGIFTGSKSIRRLRQEYWNVLFGLGETVRLSGLELSEAQALIEEPVRGKLVYSPESVRTICDLTARQPLLIQGMCDQLFQLCQERGERSITVAMAEEVAAQRVADSEHFESLWSYIKSDRQRLLTFLVDRAERKVATGATKVTSDVLLHDLESGKMTVVEAKSYGSDAVRGATFEALQDAAEQAGIRFAARELDSALEDLLDLEVIGKLQADGIARYRIEVPLFARWLQLNKDFNQYQRAALEED